MRAAALVIALLLAGCQREPSFDERYAGAQKAIRKTVNEIDGELAERERQASEAAAPATAPAPDQAASAMKAAK